MVSAALLCFRQTTSEKDERGGAVRKRRKERKLNKREGAITSILFPIERKKPKIGHHLD